MKIAVALFVAAGLASAASAQSLFNTGFEAPDYAVGNLNGQQGWQTFAGTPAPGNFNIVNDATRALAGSQFVGADTGTWATGTGQDFRVRYSWPDTTQTAGQIAAGGGQIQASVSVWVGAGTGGRTSIAGLSLFGAAGGVGIGEVDVYSTGLIAAFPGTDLTGTALGTGIGLANGFNNQWVNITLIADYNISRVSYIINGVDLTSAMVTAGFNNTIVATDWSDADLIGGRFVPTGGAATGGSELRWDNYSVSLVPAPGAAALLGLGGLVAARRRRA